MTNEELYKKIYTSIEELGTSVSKFCSDITKETGKKPNLNVTKSRNSLPNTVVFPYLKEFLSDDEMHEITLKKIDERIVTGKDRKSTRLNSSHSAKSRMPSSA